MSKLRLIVSVLIGLLAVTFVIQNTEVVSVRFLAWDLSMSRAVLVVVLLGAGFAAGWLWGRLKRRPE